MGIIYVQIIGFHSRTKQNSLVYDKPGYAYCDDFLLFIACRMYGFFSYLFGYSELLSLMVLALVRYLVICGDSLTGLLQVSNIYTHLTSVKVMSVWIMCYTTKINAGTQNRGNETARFYRRKRKTEVCFGQEKETRFDSTVPKNHCIR